MNDVLELVQFEEFFQTLEKFMRNSKRMKKIWENPSAAMLTASVTTAAAHRKWREEHPEEVRAIAEKARTAQAKRRKEHPEEARTWTEEGITALHEWREGHPEELRANAGKARVAVAQWKEEHPTEWAIQCEHFRTAGAVAVSKWREENPEKLLANTRKAWVAGAKWRKENPEEALTNSRKGVTAALAACAKWREENPEELRANAKKARVAAAKWREEYPEEARASVEAFRLNGRKAYAKIVARRYSEQIQTIKPFIPASGIRLCELVKLVPQWTYDRLKWLLKRAVKCGDLIRIGKCYHQGRQAI